jgi:hypothetical protein
MMKGMSSDSEPSVTRGRQFPDPVRIVNWPLRDEKPIGWLTAAGMVLVAALAAQASASWIMGALVFLALATSAWRLWIPVTFDFNSKGILQTALGRRRRTAWSQIAGFQSYTGGVLLLADAERSVLSPLQGVFVAWQGQRAELLRVLEYYLNAEAAPAGSTTESFRADEEE